MQKETKNHSEENNKLFGLLANRFVYQRVEQFTPETETNASEAEKAKIEKAREKMKDEIEKQISSYNETYADKAYGGNQSEKRKNAHLEPLNSDLDKTSPNEITAQIDRILTSPYLDKETGEWKAISADQTKGLLHLRNLLTHDESIQTKDSGPLVLSGDYLDEKWNNNEFVKKNPEYKIKNLNELAPTDETDEKKKVERYETILKMMDSILDGKTNYGYQGSLSINNFQKNSDIYQNLLAVRSEVTLQIVLLKNKDTGKAPGVTYTYLGESYQQSLENSAHEYAQEMTDNFDRLETMVETKSGWEKSKDYQDLESAFDMAVTTPLISAGSDDFKEFWDYSETGYSSTKFRESKELFFAILAKNTDSFKNGFILGDKFGNDIDENRENFPFIYNEWIKHEGVDTESIQKQDSLIGRLKAVAGVTAEQVLSEPAMNAAGIKASEIKNLELEYGTSSASKEKKFAKPMDKEYFSRKDGIMTNAIMRMRESIAKSGEDAALKQYVEGYRDNIATLEKLLEINTQERIRYDLLNSKKGVDASFTRYNLEKPQNRQILMEIAMKQFMKAMQMVDKPAPNGDWRSLYDPTIRRLLIASVYEDGVSRYGQDKVTGEEVYVENTNPDNYWLLSQLSKSQYFNREQAGDYMHPNQREMLAVGLTANKVAKALEYNKMELEATKKAIELKRDGADEKTVKQKMGEYPPALVKKLMDKAPADLADHMDAIAKEIKGRDEFLKRASAAIQNPFKDSKTKELSPETNSLIKDILEGKYQDFITKEEMAEYRTMIQGIEFNYNTLDLREKSKMDYLDKLGINIEGAYQAYLQAIKDDPSMNVDHWDDYFSDPKDFSKLHGFLGKILSGNNAKGKEAFLKTFETLHGFDPITRDPKASQDQWNAIQIYTMIKLEIRHREQIAAASNKNQKEVESKLKGMHLGDKITKYAKDVINMLIGPGQSWANRGAGLVILLGALKMAKMAYQGKKAGKTGQLLQLLAMAGAAEIATKKITGRGLLDRAGLDNIAGAMEGMYECVLIDSGEKFMDINKVETEEHAAALTEMNKIPFHKLMEWYETTDENGMPRDGKPDIFPKQINIGRIVKGTQWKERDKKLEARRIVKLSMLNFFEYVGQKERRDPVEAGKMLKERWIEMRKNKDFKPEHTDLIYHEMLDPYRQSPDKLTWQVVMRSEIDPYDVEQTKNKHGLSPALEYIGDTAEGLVKWGRNEILGPVRGYAEEFFKALGPKANDVKEFLAEVGEAGGRNLYFAKESAEFWYDNNKYQIRKFLGEHWELVKTGVKLPFEVIYAADQLVIPWTLTKLKQIKEIMRSDKVEQLSHELQMTDIVPAGLDVTNGNVYDLKKNPQFNYFGVYQKGFVKAFEAKETGGEPFYQTPIELEKPAVENPDQGIGYYIQETTQDQAGVNPSDATLSIDDKYNKMEAKAYEQAKRFFMGKGASAEDVEQLMYPIHISAQSGENGPQRIYTFWRMSMPGSAEYEMKLNGRWPDYINPNAHKDRLAFMVDPGKDKVDNFIAAMTLNAGPTRTLLGNAAAYGSQIFHFAMGSWSTAGNLAHWAVNLGKDAKPSTHEAIEGITSLTEESKIKLDEFTTSASKSRTLAFSEFYKDDRNRDIYKLLLDYARENQQSLYTGIFEGEQYSISDKTGMRTTRATYHADFYSEIPQGFTYDLLLKYYDNWKTDNKVIPGLEQQITRVERNAATAATRAARGPRRQGGRRGQR